MNNSTSNYFNNLNIKYVVQIGFGTILVIIFLMTIVGMVQIRQTNQDMSRIVEINNAKIENAHIMRDIIRQREVSLYSMLAMDDPFDRNDELINFYQLPTIYRKSRNKLVALPNNQKELQIYAELNQILYRAQLDNRLAADLITDDAPHEIIRDAVKKGTATRHKVLALLDKLVKLQKQYAQNTVIEGREKYDNALVFSLIIGILVIICSFCLVSVFSRYVSKKNQALVEASEKALAATKSKSTFLANMSHEIRTPMNAVLGYTQILLRDIAFPTNYRKKVQTIENAGVHLLDLINDILDLSKIEAGSMEVHTQDFDLKIFVSGMADLFEARCQRSGLTWTLENRIQGPGLVNGDQSKLRQILINFLGNAVKFTDKGKVIFTVSNTANQFCFEVTDTGMGISASELINIHEPFQQAAEGIKKGGTGLGLAISKRQLELLGSELRVDSEPGKGSRFYFHLELPDAKTTVQPRSSRDDQPVHLAPGYTVNALVVDDLESNRDILDHMLQTAGITVRTAINGQDALDKINEHIPDIIFMDIHMPEMNGSEALQHIRTKYACQSIVCIAVTSSALLHEIKRYREEGFDDIIGKPYRFADIYYRIEKFLSVKLIENKQQLVLQPDTAKKIKHQRIELTQNICLPKILYSRLREAAKFNALTDIEEIISELAKLGGESKSLSSTLQDYISNYDTEGILEMLEGISYA